MTSDQHLVFDFLQAHLAQQLKSGVRQPSGDPAAVERIDTHGASLFLAGDRAWKMKRAVRFSYMDFSTPDRRRDVLTRELALNRRTAPDLYLGLHAITREASGTLALDGAGEALDWVLEMRRFPAGSLLSQRADAGRLTLDQLKQLTDSVLDFHERAPISKEPDGHARFLAVTQGNITSLQACTDVLGEAEVGAIATALCASLASAKPLLIERSRMGRVRHVHGDLHLANIALINEIPVPFDCLEFDTELATTDTLYDIAFLLMDLWQRKLKREANEVFNRYLDRSAIDESGVALMPLFLATRAVIRAHVGAARAQRLGADSAIATEARACLQLAGEFLEAAPTMLLALGGLSGSGKSTIARQLAPSIGRAPGARLLRSDVLRKRAAGVIPETRLPQEAYGTERNAQVYEAMAALADATVQTGHSVIADAVFSLQAARQQIKDIALSAGVEFHGIWLDCDETTRVARVSARRGDASDADAVIARAQSAEAPATLEWTRIDADAEPEEVAARVVNKIYG